MALKMYLGTEDEAVCQSVAEKAMVVGYTRMLRRAIIVSITSFSIFIASVF